MGCFYLALYCFISDLSSHATRSFRITFVNNLNAFATLSVTFVCGFVIKYYGYLYLFVASVGLILVAFIYTIFFIPEPLLALRHKSFCARVKSCSVMRSLNCFRAYFNHSSKEDDETDPLLIRRKLATSPPKQTGVLFLIVFANFVFCFGAIGVSSIFNLYLMNKPFCFDSVQISNYTVFVTVTSLFMTLVVSKFVKVSDLLICIVSLGSYFASIFCYIFGDSVNYIYLGECFLWKSFI